MDVNTHTHTHTHTHTPRSNRVECEVWHSSEIKIIFFHSQTEKRIPASIGTSSWSRGRMENSALIICSYIIKQIKPPASMWIKSALSCGLCQTEFRCWRLTAGLLRSSARWSGALDWRGSHTEGTAKDTTDDRNNKQLKETTMIFYICCYICCTHWLTSLLWSGGTLCVINCTIRFNLSD